MNKILELREKRAKAWETAKNFLDSRRGENGLVSAEDNSTYEKMETEVVNLGKEIDRLEKQAAIDLELSKATSAPLLEKPQADERSRKTGRASNEYKNAFWQVMRNKAGLEVKNALQIGSDAEGGYLTPDEFEHTLVEALEEEDIFRGLANTIQTSSGDRKFSVVARIGVASWVDDDGAIPESDDSFKQVTLSAYKLATMIKISEELLNDSAFDLESYVAKEFGRRIGTKEEEALFVGDGTGKPTGILDATGGGQLGKTTSGAAAISFDEIMDLFYSLKSPYRKNATFLMNDSTVKAIRKLKDGAGQYIWQPSMVAGTPDTILNRPVLTSAYMPEISAGNKTVAFGDFKYYWIADRQGRSFKRLNELFAVTGQIGFVATQRLDGKLILPEAVKYLQQKA